MFTAIDKNNEQAVSVRNNAIGCRLLSTEEIHQRRIYDSKRDSSRFTFSCPNCGQDVFLAARKNNDDSLFYFSHLANSDDCHLKVAEIDDDKSIKSEVKESGLKDKSSESELHKDIKNTIYWSLGCKDSSIKPVSMEKRYYDKSIDGKYTDFIKSGKWRVPDVLGKHKDGFDIAFEVQCSYISPILLSNRCNFYKGNNAFVVWILPSVSGVLCPSALMDNEKQGSIYRSDLFYNNKSNIFSMDAEALNKTKETGALHLKVFYEEYIINNNNLTVNHKCKLITVDQIRYCYETNTCYYIDMTGKRDRAEYVISKAENSIRDFYFKQKQMNYKEISDYHRIKRYIDYIFYQTDVIELKKNNSYKSHISNDDFYEVYSLIDKGMPFLDVYIYGCGGLDKDSDYYGEYRYISVTEMYDGSLFQIGYPDGMDIYEEPCFEVFNDPYKTHSYIVKIEYDEIGYPYKVTINKTDYRLKNIDNIKESFDFTGFDIVIDKNTSNGIYFLDEYDLFMVNSSGDNQYIGFIDEFGCDGLIHYNMCHDKKSVELTYIETESYFHIKDKSNK